MSPGRLQTMVVVAATALVAACGPHAAPKPLSDGQLRGANLLLITIDTLRADRLGAYGSTAGLTPTLDRLASSGVRYAHAFSHAPLTLPAHTSILTGLTPPHHGVHNNVSFRLDEHVPTLATILKAAGYRTGAFIGAFVLDARFGLSRGFDVYDDRFAQGSASTFRFAERPAAAVVKSAGDWIVGPDASGARANQTAPWFGWVHLYDPHAPYRAPAEYRTGRSPYDAEVAYTDAMVGVLLDRLRSAHALDRTLIVMTADHGESLGEHGEATHGLFAYDATIAVPLVLAGTTVNPSTIDQPVAHDDIVPTVAALLGVPAPANLDGRSLVTPPGPDRAIYFEALDAQLTRDWAPLRGIVAAGWKFIDLPIPELYDRHADPEERRNVLGTEPARAEALRNRLASLASDAVDGQGRGVDAEAASRLRSLGYASGAAPTRRHAYTEADDPKRLVRLNEQFNDALQAVGEGRRADALATFEAILSARPDFLTARTSAAAVLASEGRATEAVRLLSSAPAAQADSPELLAKLGEAKRDAGDLPGALRALEASRNGGNENPELLNDLGVVYARLGRADDARAMFTTLLRETPNAAGTWYNLGLFEMSQRRTDAAAAALRHAVSADPAYGEAWKALGAALASRDPLMAADAWRHAETTLPADYDLLFNLGMILATNGRGADARPYLERFVRDAPADRYAADIARVRSLLGHLHD